MKLLQRGICEVCGHRLDPQGYGMAPRDGWNHADLHGWSRRCTKVFLNRLSRELLGCTLDEWLAEDRRKQGG